MFSFFKKLSPVLSLGWMLAVQPLSAKDIPMPPIQGIAQWFNTEKPLTPEDLKGKVIMVDFWTYSCINCIRTLPHVKALYDNYRDKGLVVIGVHTPEFDFEKNPDNVKAALAKHGLTYPVAMDNDYATWRAYSNRYWPAHYLVDRQGRVRDSHFGEGAYEETERKVLELLSEGGTSAPPEKAAAPAGTDASRAKTPEIYLGTRRLLHFGNTEGIRPGRRQTFREPKTLAAGKFSLAGDWRIDPEFAFLESSGKIRVSYEADTANMVLESGDGKEISAEIYVDGRPATDGNKGADVFINPKNSADPFRPTRAAVLFCAMIFDCF